MSKCSGPFKVQGTPRLFCSIVLSFTSKMTLNSTDTFELIDGLEDTDGIRKERTGLRWDTKVRK